MTHFQARRDALQRKAGESIKEAELRACESCGEDFLVMRSWQKQCSPRCRQRAYEFVHTPDMDSRCTRQPQGRTRD